MRLLHSIPCLILASLPLQASTLYWDTNGSTAGAGVTADGTWDAATTANWTTDSTGSIATTTYTAASDVVFSAGSDTTAATVTVSGNQAANSLTFNQGTVTFSGTSSITGVTAISVGSGAGVDMVNVPISFVSGLTLTVDGTFDNGQLNGGGNFTKDGSGTATLKRMDARVVVQAGTLIVTGSGKGKQVTVNNGATFRLTGVGLGGTAPVSVDSGGAFELANGVSQSIGALNGAGTISGGTGSFLSTTGGTFSGGASGNLSLDMRGGTGTLILSGTNTYSGNTTVTAGTFTLDTAGSMTFTIGANGVNNSVSGAGIANFNGTFAFDLSGADKTDGNTWTIANVTGGQSFAGTFGVAGFTGSSGVWTNGSGFSFDQSSGLLTYSAIPEPSTVALFGGLAALLLALRSHRKNHRAHRA